MSSEMLESILAYTYRESSQLPETLIQLLVKSNQGIKEHLIGAIKTAWTVPQKF